MIPLLDIEIPGPPRTQGSAALGVTPAGRIRPFKRPTETAHREHAVWLMRQARAGRPTWADPVKVVIVARLRRPQSHHIGGDHSRDLKPSAPREWRVGKAPDVDKIARLILDALTIARVIEDDALVAHLTVSKLWAPIDSTTVKVFPW